MVKLCNASLCKPLGLIFKSCLEWKKANVVVPAHKKDQQILKNYRPYLCFPIPEKHLKEYTQKII